MKKLTILLVALCLFIGLNAAAPRTAQAVSFGVNVWLGLDVVPLDVHFAVLTFSDEPRVNQIEEVEMNYMGQDFLGFYKWRVTFVPNPAGFYWSARATFDDLYELEEENPYPVGPVNYGGGNICPELLNVFVP